MIKGWGMLPVTALFVMMAAGCTAQPETPEPSRQETLVEEEVGVNESNNPQRTEDITEKAEERTVEPDTSSFESGQFSVEAGDSVKLETSLEHEAAIFDGTEYEIKPYGVIFAVRTNMGKPVIEDGKIVLSKDLSGTASITVEVMEKMSMDEAVTQVLENYGESFSGDFIETTSKAGLKGKHNQFNDDSVFSGVILYEFNRHVLRIEYRSPIDAVDAMVRIVNETMDSVKMRE